MSPHSGLRELGGHSWGLSAPTPPFRGGRAEWHLPYRLVQAGGWGTEPPEVQCAQPALMPASCLCPLSIGAMPSTSPPAPGASAWTSPSASGGPCCSIGPPRGPHRPRTAQSRSHSSWGRRALPPQPPLPPRPTLISCGNGPLVGTPCHQLRSATSPAGHPLETEQTPANHGHCRAARDANQPGHVCHPKAIAGHGEGDV